MLARSLLLWCLLCDMFFFFFFSSRRRHTRLVSDWSSDVCSSDLWCPPRLVLGRVSPAGSDDNGVQRRGAGTFAVTSRMARVRASSVTGLLTMRSEERRVGKECRSRWWADH